jgi:hypothetical protein
VADKRQRNGQTSPNKLAHYSPVVMNLQPSSLN